MPPSTPNSAGGRRSLRLGGRRPRVFQSSTARRPAVEGWMCAAWMVAKTSGVSADNEFCIHLKVCSPSARRPPSRRSVLPKGEWNVNSFT